MTTRARILLLVVCLCGVPAVVTGTLLSTYLRNPSDGSQPGGALQGVVRDTQGRTLKDVPVELLSAKPTGERQRLAQTLSGENGEFAFTAPPAEGHYEVRAGGGDWQRLATNVSLLDRQGAPREVEPLLFTLPLGTRLRVDFERRDERPMRGGAYQLEGTYGGSLFTALGGAHWRHAGVFAGSALELDGLPPMKAKLKIQLDSGEKVELELELALGLNRHTVEL